MKLIFFILALFISLKTTLANGVAFADSIFFAGNYEKALKEYEYCLINDSKLDKSVIGIIYLRKGICHYELNQNKETFVNYFKALKCFETINDKLRIAKTCLNLASSYFKEKDFANSEKYLLRSDELFTSLKDTVELIRVFGTKALLYNETIGSQKAIETRLYALKYFKKYFDIELETNYYFNLGDDYVLFNKDSAIICYEKSLKLIDESGDSTLINHAFVNLGSIYLENDNLPKAIFYLTKASKLMNIETDTMLAREFYKYYAIYHYKIGSYKLAYEYADSAKLYDNALYNTEKTRVAADLSEKYEAEKKDATIAQQKYKNRNTTLGLIATGIGLGIVALLAAFSFRQYKKKQKANALLEEQNNAIQQLNQQLHEANQTKVSLFSIISHDLRAPLSSLYAQLQTQNLKQDNIVNSNIVTKQTEQLLDTLENLLLWSKTQLDQFELHPVSTSLPQIFKTVELLYSPIITSKKITIVHQITNNTMLYTDDDILQVIARNIYSNALQNAPMHSTIKIQYQLYDGLHVLECVNDYNTATMPTTEYLSERGLGTTLVKDFCHKINATVHFSAGESQYTVMLKVPSIK